MAVVDIATLAALQPPTVAAGLALIEGALLLLFVVAVRDAITLLRHAVEDVRDDVGAARWELLRERAKAKKDSEAGEGS